MRPFKVREYVKWHSHGHTRTLTRTRAQRLTYMHTAHKFTIQHVARTAPNSTVVLILCCVQYRHEYFIMYVVVFNRIKFVDSMFGV